MDSGRESESELREKFSGGLYSADRISRPILAKSDAYFDVLLRTKLELVLAQPGKNRVLDLGCATGEHLLHLARDFGEGIGLDFSHPYLERARDLQRQSAARNVRFVQGNARRLPFQEGSLDVIYSFSTLYCMPEAGEVLAEIGRVLRQGGRCVLDMGNRNSLNTLVAGAYPELARPYHLPVGGMKRRLQRAGLRILEHRAFQILPLWGDRPAWLKPLLSPCWVRIMQRKFAGRMLDEWICAVPVLRSFAFRHLFVCEKM